MPPRSASRVWLVLVLGTSMSACGGSEKPPVAEPIPIPVRTATAGDALLSLVPRGASLIVEIDLARLRANPEVGEVVTALGEEAASQPGPGGIAAMLGGAGGLDLAVLARVDTLLVCAYDVGKDSARALTLLAGARVAELPVVARRGRQIRQNSSPVWALGPAELVDRTVGLARGQGKALGADRALLATRAGAMPAAAPGAFLRVAARLDFAARVALAARYDLDHVPTELSVWADVADDLAVVARLGSDAGETSAMMGDIASLRARLASLDWIRTHALHFLVQTVDVSRAGDAVRATLVISPRRLARMMDRAQRALDRPEPPPGESSEKPVPVPPPARSQIP